MVTELVMTGLPWSSAVTTNSRVASVSRSSTAPERRREIWGEEERERGVDAIYVDPQRNWGERKGGGGIATHIST